MSLRVDVATGATSLSEVDLFLPGYLPLELARGYRSDNARVGPFGPGWTFNYDVTLDVGPRHTTYRDASDREIYFRPIGAGMEVRHPEAGLTLQHRSDAYVLFASPLVQQVFLKKNASGTVLRLDRIEDLNGNAVQLLYKGTHLIGLVDSVGRQVQCAYANDRLASIQVVGAGGTEAHAIRSFRYDAQGHLVGAADETRREAQYAYDGPLMVAYTNRLGGVQYAQYDADRRCLALWRGDGSATRLLAYDILRQTTRALDAHGAQTVYRNVGPQVLARTDPLGRTRDYYYDERQHLTGFSDGTGAIVSFQHLDPDAGTLTQLDAGRLALFQFDDRGRATTVSDGQNEYALAYDDRGNLVGLTTPTGAAWSFERDKQGRVAQITSPEGRRVRLTYSPEARRRTVEDDLGPCFEEQYDDRGRLLERVDAMGRREQRAYDPAGRLTTVKIDGGYEVRFTYDAAGNLTAASDSRHRNVKQQYDAFGRLVARTEPDGRHRQFAYDREDRLVAARMQGKTARFGYDEGGRLVRAESWSGAVETYRYEADGGIVVQRGEAETRLGATPYLDWADGTGPDEAARRFEYGLWGELLSAVSAGREATFTYDEEGRLATVLRDDSYFTFAYDRDGNLASVGDGTRERVALRYDPRGRVAEALVDAHPACRFAYDDGDRLTTLELVSGGRFTFTYDRLDRLEGRDREAPNREASHHRFHSKEAHPVADRLPSPGAAASSGRGNGEEAAWAVLYQSRNGLVLAARLDGVELPVWFQDHYFIKGEAGLNRVIADAVAHGADAVLRGRAMATGPELLRRWTRAARERVRIDYTEVPRLHRAAPLWRGLDQFFLARAFYDGVPTHRLPGFLIRHQEGPSRSDDEALTGTHRIGYLKPYAWDNRAADDAQRSLSPVVRRGRLHPDDVDLLFADQR